VIYNTGSIVIIPFPFTDKATTKKRPAVVVSNPSYQKRTNHVVLMMITSSKQSAWALDTPITDLTLAGLPTPCLIRQKIFTLDERLILAEKGKLSATDFEQLQKNSQQLGTIGL
jgi:mRNA interferase MazF